jgi:hypothetical protein
MHLSDAEAGASPFLKTTNIKEKEVYEAIMQMENNKALGPEGFRAELCQKFWDTIKVELMNMLAKFQQGELRLFHLNYGIIVLLPKKENAIQIEQYSHIGLFFNSANSDNFYARLAYF